MPNEPDDSKQKIFYLAKLDHPSTGSGFAYKIPDFQPNFLPQNLVAFPYLCRPAKKPLFLLNFD